MIAIMSSYDYRATPLLGPGRAAGKLGMGRAGGPVSRRSTARTGNSGRLVAGRAWGPLPHSVHSVHMAPGVESTAEAMDRAQGCARGGCRAGGCVGGDGRAGGCVGGDGRAGARRSQGSTGRDRVTGRLGPWVAWHTACTWCTWGQEAGPPPRKLGASWRWEFQLNLRAIHRGSQNHARLGARQALDPAESRLPPD